LCHAPARRVASLVQIETLLQRFVGHALNPMIDGGVHLDPAE
jgi:hypothetical protein